MAAITSGNVDPIKVFENSVASGTVTVATAEICLRELFCVYDGPN
jgi:hypothetical protein